MTRLSSSQQINSLPVPSSAVPTPPLSNNIIVTGSSKWGIPNNNKVSSGGVTVTTISPPRIPRPHSQGPLTLITPMITNHNSQVSKLVNVRTRGRFLLLILAHLDENCISVN